MKENFTEIERKNKEAISALKSPTKLLKSLRDEDTIKLIQVETLVNTILNKGKEERTVDAEDLEKFLHHYERFKIIKEWCVDKKSLIEKIIHQDKVTHAYLKMILEDIVTPRTKVLVQIEQLSGGLKRKREAIKLNPKGQRNLNKKITDFLDYVRSTKDTGLDRFIEDIKNKSDEDINEVVKNYYVSIVNYRWKNFVDKILLTMAERDVNKETKNLNFLFRYLHLLNYNYSLLYKEVYHPTTAQNSSFLSDMELIQKLVAKAFFTAASKAGNQIYNKKLEELEVHKLNRFCDNAGDETGSVIEEETLPDLLNQIGMAGVVQHRQIGALLIMTDHEAKERNKELEKFNSRNQKQIKNTSINNDENSVAAYYYGKGPVILSENKHKGLDYATIFSAVLTTIIEKLENGIAGYIGADIKLSETTIKAPGYNFEIEAVGIIKISRLNAWRERKRSPILYLDVNNERRKQDLDDDDESTDLKTRAVQNTHDRTPGDESELKAAMRNESKDPQDDFEDDDIEEHLTEDYNSAVQFVESDEESEIYLNESISQDENGLYEDHKNIYNLVAAILHDNQKFDRKRFDELSTSENWFTIIFHKIVADQAEEFYTSKNKASSRAFLNGLLLKLKGHAPDHKSFSDTERQSVGTFETKLYQIMFSETEIKGLIVKQSAQVIEIVNNHKNSSKEALNNRYPKMQLAIRYTTLWKTESSENAIFQEIRKNQEYGEKEIDELKKDIREGGGEILKQLFKSNKITRY